MCRQTGGTLVYACAHKSDIWCVWLHRIYGDGRVELSIWLAVPIFNMFEFSPLWRSVLVLLLLLSSTFLLSSGVHVQSGLRDSDTLIYLLLRLMVPRRVPRAISPWATLRRAYRLSINQRPRPDHFIGTSFRVCTLSPSLGKLALKTGLSCVLHGRL